MSVGFMFYLLICCRTGHDRQTYKANQFGSNAISGLYLHLLFNLYSLHEVVIKKKHVQSFSLGIKYDRKCS